MTDNWPEHAEELARKVLTTLEMWMMRHEAGLITKRELWLVCDALYDSVCGLVDWVDCANIILAVRDSLEVKPF